MDLLALTQGRFVWLGLDAPRKEVAIEQLLDLLLGEGALPQDAREELLDAVMQRERRLSTGLECGVAIPHGTTPRLDREVAALGVYPSGVPFEAVDEGATKIVILLMTPQRERHRHVSNLATIAKQLLCADVRRDLLAARSREEAVAVIRRNSSDSSLKAPRV